MNKQPYQSASEEMMRQTHAPGKFLKGAASTGLGTVGGAASLGLKAVGAATILNRVKPFLNELIPSQLAVKGLSKISPTLGKFIDVSLKQGHSLDDVMGFIKEKSGLSDDQASNQKKAPEQQNIIAQYDDQLHSFLENLIKSGRSPLEAGALARSSGKFDKAIKKMEKDHKANWSQILESVYGLGEQAQQQNQLPQAQLQQAPQVQVQPQNNNDQMLIAALEKILQM